MNKKSSIIISSIAACAIFASAFAFNGFAVGDTAVSQQVKSSNIERIAPVNKVKSVSTKNNQQTNIKSADIKNNVQSVLNNANINEDTKNKLQSIINDCDDTTAKNINYSAIKAKLDSLLKSIDGSPATKPVPSTPAPSKPTPSKPTPSTPIPSKPAPTTPTPTVPSNGDYSAFQKKVVELVNVERSKNGLKPLTMNTELSKVATLKSQDMAKLNYFDHNSPTYGSPFDMMKKYGISYKTAGENIAMGQSSPEQVMQGWMNSPGHRANILKSSFTEIGVGVAKNSSGRLYWTQQFIG